MVCQLPSNRYFMENQAVSFEQLYYEVMEALYLIDEAMGSYSRLIDCYLTDDKNIFAIVAQDGKLYKQHFILEGDDLMIGDFEEIPLENESMTSPSMQVIQQEDGKYRWFGIAANTALNKNGNLNSKKLYDSFIQCINETGEYPILNFYHQPNTRLGIADFAARDDNLYILSGTFDNTEFGLAAAKGLMNDTDGYWGQSIEFWYQDVEWYTQEVDNAKIQIPIFTSGINGATSILPANDAACLGTGIISKSNSGVMSMNSKVKEAAVKLLGDRLADIFEEQADEVNQEINENMVHQTTEETVEDEIVNEVEEEVLEDELDTEEGEVIELEFDLEDVLTDLVNDEGFNQMVQGMILSHVMELQSEISRLQNEVNQVRQAQQNVEVQIRESEQEKRQRWDNDKPASRTVVSYRARQPENVATVVQNGSYENKANSVLNKIKMGVR